jgi:AraC-like DNA-binding protein
MRGHPARQLPYSFELKVPDFTGDLRRVTLIGVFALFVDATTEPWGTFGATLQGFRGRDEAFRQDLLNGEAYGNGRDLTPVSLTNGTGLSLETLGTVEIDGSPARLDALTVDVPPGTSVDIIRFKDLGSPASFVIYDVFVEVELVEGCPFREQSGGVPLSELASIVRLGDRVRFAKAVAQLDASIEVAIDLDEARGQALTFLAILTAATLETGGSRRMIKVCLETARLLDRQQGVEEIREVIHKVIEDVVGSVLHQTGSSSALVDRALAHVERHYARNLSDETIAATLGLSTSHFRFLFRQATGQPFHRYLIGLRLEKAKRLLLEDNIPVSRVASAVGFTGLSHFSRAFTARFRLSPTQFRHPGSAAADDGSEEEMPA